MAISSDCFHLCLLNIEQSCERLKHNNIISSSTSTTNRRKSWCCSRKNQQNQWTICRRKFIRQSWSDLKQFNCDSIQRTSRFVNWRWNWFNHTLTSNESFERSQRRCFCENIYLMRSTDVLHSNEMNSQRLFWL